MSTYLDDLAIALDAVREAAGLCVAVQQGTAADALAKKDRSPVTVADFGSQALVCRALREAFPDDPIIAEEDSQALRAAEQRALVDRVLTQVQRLRGTATLDEMLGWIDFGGQRDYCDRFWTLDPIDGTKGFLRGEQYAIALALIENGRPVLGVLGCPNLPIDGLTAENSFGSIYYAIAGQGTHGLPYRPGVEEPTDQPRPIRVSEIDATREASFCESVESGHSDHGESNRLAAALGITRGAVRLDSQAKYAVVARGEADIYLRLPTRADYREKIWDHAAGCLVVEEAGGRVTDVQGRPLEFSLGSELSNNAGIVATNGRLHEAVLAAVQ